MHVPVVDLKEVLETDPIDPEELHIAILRSLIILGLLALLLAFYVYPTRTAWGMYYTNVLFWMGISAGSVAFTAILQVVGAKWSMPIRRVAEAQVTFFFFGYVLFLFSYFGRAHLFSWAAEGGMPGRGWWMNIDIVYSRYALLLGLLFLVMWRFVRLSLRGDVGLVRESAEPASRWFNFSYNLLVRNWRGSAEEIPAIQRRLASYAPAVLLLYAFVYSLFVFDMVMSMDGVWSSNLIGAFITVGNVYAALAMTTLLVLYFARKSPAFDKCLTTRQTWDLGKLVLGFCMLWAYMVFSQFLANWYGNIPEETQWIILRTRDYPWKTVSWTCFTFAFITPFLLLLSRDLKKTPRALGAAVTVPLVGVFLEKYLLIMPLMSPAEVPFSSLDVLVFLGFLGLYALSVVSFIRRYPFVAVASCSRRVCED